MWKSEYDDLQSLKIHQYRFHDEVVINDKIR